jgi:hypothetical protein
MTEIQITISVLFVIIGIIFMLVGSIGIIRCPISTHEPTPQVKVIRWELSL